MPVFLLGPRLLDRLCCDPLPIDLFKPSFLGSRERLKVKLSLRLTDFEVIGVASVGGLSQLSRQSSMLDSEIG